MSFIPRGLRTWLAPLGAAAVPLVVDMTWPEFTVLCAALVLVSYDAYHSGLEADGE